MLARVGQHHNGGIWKAASDLPCHGDPIAGDANFKQRDIRLMFGDHFDRLLGVTGLRTDVETPLDQSCSNVGTRWQVIVGDNNTCWFLSVANGNLSSNVIVDSVRQRRSQLST